MPNLTNVFRAPAERRGKVNPMYVFTCGRCGLEDVPWPHGDYEQSVGQARELGWQYTEQDGWICMLCSRSRGRQGTSAAGLATGEERTIFRGWAILELMGHRRLAGLVQECQIAGAGLLRIDIPATDRWPGVRQYYAPLALYCLTPTTEEIARAIAAEQDSGPLNVYEARHIRALLPQRAEPDHAEYNRDYPEPGVLDADDDDDPDDDDADEVRACPRCGSQIIRDPEPSHCDTCGF